MGILALVSWCLQQYLSHSISQPMCILSCIQQYCRQVEASYEVAFKNISLWGLQCFPLVFLSVLMLTCFYRQSLILCLYVFQKLQPGTNCSPSQCQIIVIVIVTQLNRCWHKLQGMQSARELELRLHATWSSVIPSTTLSFFKTQAAWASCKSQQKQRWWGEINSCLSFPHFSFASRKLPKLLFSHSGIAF